MQIYNHSKMYCVYSITCNLTNKIYVGSTSNFTNRLRHHISTHKKTQINMQFSINFRKYKL